MTLSLEEQVAHLQKTVEELSDVVSQQSTQIDKLTRTVKALAEREKMREVEGGGGALFTDERPPHY